uniref:NADH-ubiquinone oxidoreductase chain 5 n=2 Tax=Perumytilus purpuratus TaxID=390823 RepID=A0A346KL32_PERPP|nr:NADH dehydrogenase subunit 5 [Perumytilus purpuratus]
MKLFFGNVFSSLSSSVSSLLSFLAVCFGYMMMFSCMLISSCEVIEFELWSGCGSSVMLSLLFDEVSVIFGGVVLVISGSVSLYSKWYMDDEIFYWRFMLIIYAFVGSMLMLIFSANLISLMLGWDGLGLVSFLLVCYYQNSSSLGAAMITVLTNRVGDVLILSSIGLMSSWGDWLVYNRVIFNDLGYVGFFVVVAGMTKSAQMPFCSWLPAAMAAPTPVSSLVHSSTLVTAGVYLIIRCYPLCSDSSGSMFFLKLMSLLTLIMAGMSGSLETDFKKIIALSTLSQLSIMMFAVSVGLPMLAFFHLITHATFKALLFISAGTVIHSNKGSQDLRLLGGMWSSLPITSAIMVVASFSLCGIPFMSGFFSKDLIIEMSMMCTLDVWAYLIMLLGVSFTSLYSIRIVISVLFSMNKVMIMGMAMKEPVEVVISYFCLFFGAVFSGMMMKSHMSTFFYQNFVDSVSFVFIVFIPLYGAVWYINFMVFSNFVWYSKLTNFVSSMWNLKNLSAQPFCSESFMYGYSLARCMDQGWLEKVGPQGVYETLMNLGQFNQKVQSSYFVKLVMFSILFFSIVLFLSLVILVIY